ncbi:basic helix-loop-helix domain-containing protein USF3 [Heterodontus francisci]|uniref:basic helix-loop-helix domain-containing protein USF3 n=1 Tax=Heterodontus francisci TaxID=7792 RepID=UPI00355B1AFD
MPEMTENQTPMHRTHRQKNRETHNAVERHRKKKINSGINKIGELIPCSPALKQSKNMILDQAYKYISELKRQNDEILLNGGTKEQGEEIVRLRKQLNELQKENDRFAELLKANDICLHDDPTIHWKRKLKSTKVTMVISSNQMQDDILVCTNGNQLNGNCQQAAVHSSPEVALNTLNTNTSETCLDIMVPVAMPDICPLANGAQLHTQISQQEVPECLPTTKSSLNTVQCTSSSSIVQSVLNVSTNGSGKVVLQCPLSSCASTPLACPTSTSAQIVLERSMGTFVQSILDAANGRQTQNVLDITTSTCFALPLHSQQIGTPCTGVDSPSGASQESVLGLSPVSSQSPELRSTRLSVTECSQNMLTSNICQSAPVSVGGFVIASPSFKLGAMSNRGVMSSCPMASSWTISFPTSTYTGTSDSNSVSTFSRMTSAGNTQTTWTTLQLAGNTVHPVSQVGCNILPAPLSENLSARNTFSISESGQPFNNVTVVPSASTSFHGVSFCSAYRQLKQQVAVTLQPPIQPLPLQPVLAQPQIPAQPAAKVVSLLPPLQVIQMARPAGSSVSSTPNNQNLIILQPANPTSPAVVRGAINSQAQGQQIVIIQAASQNAVSVVPAQTNNRLPAHDSNQLVCSSSNAQSTPSIQTVGGKHLVHILPRPVSSSSSTSSQSFPVTGSGQQQQTISVNGQLFALQPVKQSGASSQNTMQIIQPTTSADPNTNVALNTFGALTNLSQSISQMAGQGGLQLGSGHTANPSVTANGQIISVSSSASETTVTSTDISRTSLSSSAWHTTSLCSLKPPLGPAPSCKTKKLQKKPLSAKQGVTRKATCIGNKSKVAANCVEYTRSNKDNLLQLLTSDDQISSSKGLTISQTSSQSQIPMLVAATMTTSVASQEVIDRQQSVSSLSQHVLPPCLTEPALAESIPQEQSDILAEISATSVLTSSLPPSSSQGDMPKNVLCVSSSPCVITDISTSVPPSSPYCSNAPLHISGGFSVDKDSDLVELQTAVANVCSTPGITTVSAQLESLTAVPHQGSASDKERSQDWHKGRLEMDRFSATKEISNQDGSSLMRGVTHSDKATSNEKSSLLSFVKDSCADNELCVDRSRETSTGMLFYEKGEPQKDILLVSTESNVQQQLCNPDQEGMGGSLIVHRQTESPMSTSSGSSRGFSVASMLPDSTREDPSCISTMTSTFNNYSLSEQNDIVALAARAIFEHGSPGKGLTSEVTVCDVRSKAQKIPFAEKEECPSQQSSKSLGGKESCPSLMEASATEDQVQQSVPMDTNSTGTSINKSSTSAVKEISNMPLICTSSVSANLSVINHACYSEASQMHACSPGQTQLVEHLPVCATADLSNGPTSYTEQSSQTTLLVEYSHEQLDSVKGNSQTSLVLEPRLKQSGESRKDTTKRTGPGDDLISTAKRQKQCQNANMRLESKSTVSTVPEHISDCGQAFIGQLPTNSSSLLVSGSNPGHTDSLSTLFPPTNFLTSNVVETLRPSEAHCNIQPRIQEGQGSQQLQQHVVPQQTVSSQTGLNVHHGHLYYKHHQGQIRERHLYQLQHHLSHNESSVQPQAHGAQQPRAAQQDIQMQKKRGLMRGSQASQLPLQQKQHPSGNGQGRQKGNHHHHQQHHQQQQLQQQMPHPHFGSSQQDKRCDNSVTNRNHHSSHTQSLHSQDLMHQQQQDNARSGQQGSGVPAEQSGQSRIQRLLTSRSLDQQMVSKSNSVSRPSDMQCTSHRQERNRISSYSAEALIRKAPSNAESRMAMAMQSPRSNLEQSEMRTYLDLSMNKNMPVPGLQAKLSLDHCMNSDVQGLPDCPPFKVSATTQGVGTFEVQSSRGSEMVNSMPTHRGMQPHGFRLGHSAGTERQARLPYLPMQGISSGSGVSLRENEGSCHQSFMQSLLAPPLSEQISGNQRSVSEHPRNSQCVPPASIAYSCPSVREGVHIRRDGEVQNRESCDMTLGALSSRNSSLSISYSNPSSVADSQGRNTSPNVSAQKNSLRMNKSQANKCHPNSQVSPNVHGAVRPVMSHAAVSHGGNEQGHSIQQPSSSVSQRARHPAQDGSASKMRQTERSSSGNHRSGNVFEHSLQLPLTSSGGMILGRQQPVTARTGSIVRFMTEGQQLPNDNLAPDQHSLSQNFGFPFIPESSMNPPINANPSFIPPVTQPGTNRTPALIPVEPQNPLSSFYPPYSPAHPNLSNDLSIPYFSNQIFSSPSTEKANAGALNNPFGSILSPPRPVGFPQPNFPLLPDIPARPMANTSSITPHLSNFNLTTLFPEIAAAPLAPESAAMPMSPLLPLTNPALSDVSKQHSNRSAHNISHILGHDGSSAV